MNENRPAKNIAYYRKKIRKTDYRRNGKTMLIFIGVGILENYKINKVGIISLVIYVIIYCDKVKDLA